MKKCPSRLLAIASLLILATISSWAEADVKLPKVIDSHMVLQRERPLPIWGWADPGETVTVRLDGASVQTTADGDGNWNVVLPAMSCDGKAHHMTISGKNKIELKDILVGEVWVGSGQSNMEMGMKMINKADEEIAAADHPQIRLLLVPKTLGREPAKDVKSHWVACTPETIASGGWGGFSAALYFFGRNLHKELNVPVGLIQNAWGGQRIERFTPSDKKNGDIYNGMIAPVKPFAIRGAIWYQGEANVGDGMKYADKMKALIGGLRQVWGYDFPFYFVEIAPWSGYRGNGLPQLWEAQVASLKIPRTGMVVTTDLVDNLKDIHPKDKVDVGNRLALWALAKIYGKDVAYTGPLYKSMSVEGNKVRLSFAHVDGGLKSRDGKPLSEFEIAGEDGKFVPAEAAIEGDAVVVQSKDVSSPTQVRFGWRSVGNPNLENKAGLPASPFQTSNWQGGTGE
jgi:sialate O-acetylesterase